MSEIFSVTPKAVAHVLSAMAEEGLAGHGLRIGVVPGGCSGYEYSMSFVAEGEAGDHVVDAGDFRVFIDPNSTDKLTGTVLDYVDGLYGAQSGSAANNFIANAHEK